MRSRGLTLAELIVAMALASLSVLALVAYFAAMHKASAEGHSQASASTTAGEILERLRVDPEFLATVEAQPVFQVTEPVGAGKTTREPRVFTVQVAMVRRDAEGRYRDVAVEVRWNEQGRDRKVVLETVIQAPEPRS